MGANVSSCYQGSVNSKRYQVIAFHSSSKWRTYLLASKQIPNLTVVEFTATWCGPCQDIQPAFHQFADKYAEDVEFVKIDTDELSDVAKELGVQSMPTFILFKRGKEVDRVVGAKKEDLQMKIDKHRF